jgi:hypothetical protein
MEKGFQMSMMEEITFFLCIQVKQMKQCILIHQAKYMKDLIKKFNKAELKPVSTPMSTGTALDPDKNGDVVDQREYRSMIGSLLYLTVTQLDIQFIVCMCARFQSSPRSSHRIAIQQIFKYLKHTPEFGILLLLRLILLAFPMLILWVVGSTERAPLVHVIFSDLLLFAGLLKNNLQLLNPS